MDNPQQKKRLFRLSSLSIDNSTSIFVLVAMIVIFGLSAYQSIPKEQFPEISLPTIYINTAYPGNSAPDIENLVTRPIEKELNTVSGVKEISSSSIQDFSVITVEFESDYDTEEALRKTKDAVDKAKIDLPTDLPREPDVFDVNFAELPIMTINLSGNFSNQELRSYAEYLQDEIEDVKEITRVEIKGSREHEVKVDVDPYKAQAVKVSFQDIENAISSENLTMSGGELIKNGTRRAIRVVGEFKNVQEIADLIIKSENQRPIYLRDLAKVSFGYKEETSIARADELPVVSLDVIKRQGQNLIEAADKIKVLLREAENEVLPSNLEVSLFNDTSINTKNEVANLENSIISGVLLVVLVLLFFLGLRNALLVGIAIPLSMLMGFLILSSMGYTMNVVVLFSLILALGMLVDNAIVVIENIYRYLQEGYTSYDAARYGVGEVAVPIITSTATTLAAFFPLIFWPGLMGEFMSYLPITLIVVLSSSLFVALVVNPVFASVFVKVDQREDDPVIIKKNRKSFLIYCLVLVVLMIIGQFSTGDTLRNFSGITLLVSLIYFFALKPISYVFQDRFLPALESSYKGFLKFALNWPKSVFVSTFILLVAAIALLMARAPKVELFPQADPLYVNAFVELPIGKDISATDALVAELEDKISKAVNPYGSIVEAVLAQIGENTADPSGPPEPGASPNKARITVSFVPSQDRNGVSTWEIMEKVREAVKGYAGVQIMVDKNQDGPPTGKPINLELKSKNIDDLITTSGQVIQYMNGLGIRGIEELKADVQLGKPELIVNIDREAARKYELSTYAIANEIRTAVYGKEVSKFKQGEDDYEIFVRLDEKYRNNLDDLINQKVTFRNPSNGKIVQVPISAVATIDYNSTYTAVKRKDLERVITVYSNVLEGYNANEIVEQLQTNLLSYDFPKGVVWSFTGEQEEQADAMGFLGQAFLIAIFAIFFILVAQFNSLLSPFIIILSVLFSTIGVFLGYSFTGMDVVIIMTGVGIISLAGIVVNNAIVLIDYTELQVQEMRESLNVGVKQRLSIGLVHEAIVKAGATRLRPVLLTAITTILGLIPLAIGFNINFTTLITELNPHIFIGGDNVAFWGPLSWTVIYGLVFSTFLTLIVVPVMYFLFRRIRITVAEWVGRGREVVSNP